MIGSVIIGLILLVFANRKVHQSPYMLVLRCRSEAAESAASALIVRESDGFKVKAKTVSASGIELSAQVKLRGGNTGFINQVCALEGVESCSLVSYNGEYVS